MRCYFLLLVLLCGPLLLVAQQNTVSPGIRADAGLRIPLWAANKPVVGPRLAGDISAFVEIRGKEENALGFIGAFGATVDHTKYSLGNGNYFTTTGSYFHVSGQIVFPLANKHFEFLAGIDLWVFGNSGMSVLVSSNSSSGGGGYAVSMDLDSNYNLIQAAQRKLIPGISAGLRYFPVPGKSISIYAMFTQPLLSRLDEDVNLFYEVDGIRRTLTFNQQPTYLRLGVAFRLMR